MASQPYEPGRNTAPPKAAGRVQLREGLAEPVPIGNLTRLDRVAAIVAVNTFGWRPSGVMFRPMLWIVGEAPMRELDVFTGFLPVPEEVARLTPRSHPNSRAVGLHFPICDNPALAAKHLTDWHRHQSEDRTRPG